MPSVRRWERFEAEFTSTTKYRAPLHDARVTAEFTSPSGARFKAEAFWDGGSRWRLRFAPGELGEWSYLSTCSDTANRGLHNRSGRFLCTAASVGNRFAEHGPVQVAADGRHFEHADHTPFLWLGDAAWDSARTASLKTAQNLATQRSTERFTAVHCTLSPGTDAAGEAAFSGKSPLAINLNFCRHLDAKIESFNKAGLLVALAPLCEIGLAPAQVLPEDEAVGFLRYAVARWGAHQVAWVVAIEGQSIGARVTRWRRIGRAVFSDVRHGPVILWPGETVWLLDEFRPEAWVDAFGYQTRQAVSDDGLQWLFAGPLASEWQKSPPRPLLNLAPPAQASAGFGPEQARRLLWWSILLQPVGGTSCGTESNLAASAKAVMHASELLNGIEFWRLRPMPQAIAGQPGVRAPRRHIAAAGSERKDLLLIYVPEDRALEIAAAALPVSPVATWFNPRTGETSPVRFALDGSTAKLVTPAAGDWLLVVRTSR